MNQQTEMSSGGSARAESDRVRLARVARNASLRVSGVMGTDAGPLGLHVTAAGDGERLEGVTCVAAVGGAYEVSLRLVCDLVPLHPLAERVRAAVLRAAAATGVELESIGVHFAALAVTGDREQ